MLSNKLQKFNLKKQNCYLHTLRKIKIDKTEINLQYFHALKFSNSLIYDSCIFYIITFHFGVIQQFIA